MNFEAFANKALYRDFGEPLASSYAKRSEQLQREYINQIDDKGNTTVRNHITNHILPFVCLFYALVEGGNPSETAQHYMTKLMHQLTEKQSVSMRRMAQVPFFFPLFRRISPLFMKKSYPIDGWDMRWNKCDREEIAFDCHRCIYMDITTQLGCPELCTAFCENDDITYGAMAPNVIFVRTKTLADGGECCDFRLLNGKVAEKDAHK
ncbi:MAG: L-2-amino-thiazoline-4-carboxylic acid hydrolase [Suipraeoptans sp.]